MRILFVTSYVPDVQGGGSSIRSYNFIKGLSERHTVAEFALSNGSPRDREAVTRLEGLGVQAITVPLRWSERACSIKKVARLVSRLPYQVQPFVNPDIAAAFQRALTNFHPEIVHVDLLRMAWCVGKLRGGIPAVLDMHNVESQRLRSERSQRRLTLQHRLMAAWEESRLKQFEASACHRASWVIGITPQDVQALRQAARHDRVTCVPVGVDTDYFRTGVDSGAPTLIFAGSMFYFPNVDAMVYFCKEIWPTVALRIPEAQLLVVGRDPSPEVLALADSHIKVVGTVPDVRPYFAQSAVCVIPVRVGGGIKQKLLEAMAMGVPVVTTPFSCVGVPLRPGEHALVCDTPGSFADAVIRLLENPQLRQQIASAGARFVRANYNWNQSTALLEQVYMDAIHAT